MTSLGKVGFNPWVSCFWGLTTRPSRERESESRINREHLLKFVLCYRLVHCTHSDMSGKNLTVVRVTHTHTHTHIAPHSDMRGESLTVVRVTHTLTHVHTHTHTYTLTHTHTFISMHLSTFSFSASLLFGGGEIPHFSGKGGQIIGEAILPQHTAVFLIFLLAF